MGNRKQNNIHIMGIPEGEETKQRFENIFEEIMTENFHNLVNKKDTQLQEAQKVPNKLDPKRHIIIKMTRHKDKERILKAAGEMKAVTYKGAPSRLSSDYSLETFQVRREWCEIFKVMKSKGLQPMIFTQQGYHLKLKKK